MPVVFSGWTSDGRAHALLDLYRDTLLAGGFDDETVEACLSWAVFTVPVIVGRTQREAEARLEDYRQVAAAGPSTRRHGATFWEREWTQREVGKTSVAVVGSPERIVDHIGESVAAGARGVRILPVQVAGRPEEQGEFLDIILEEIVPRLAPQPLPAHIVTPS
jgi:hypothetical protein